MDRLDQKTAVAAGASAPSAMPPTLWTMVLAAGAGSDAALEQLCRLYWRPLHAYLRRWGFNDHDAEDFTQMFLAHLLRKDRLAGVRREKGRFRSYLLAALKNFVADRSSGPRRPKPVPLPGALPDPGASPEEEFERSFTMTLIQRALDRLGEDYARRGMAERFAVLRQFLPGEEPASTQAEVGLRLGLSEGAVGKAVYDLRRRFAKCFREVVAQTVSAFEEVEDEVKHHLAVMSR